MLVLALALTCKCITELTTKHRPQHTSLTSGAFDRSSSRCMLRCYCGTGFLDLWLFLVSSCSQLLQQDLLLWVYCTESCIDISGLWRKQGKLVFAGLDNSGKTTLLYLLSDQLEPSYYRRNNMYREAAQLTLGNVCYSIYELSSGKCTS